MKTVCGLSVCQFANLGEHGNYGGSKFASKDVKSREQVADLSTGSASGDVPFKVGTARFREMS